MTAATEHSAADVVDAVNFHKAPLVPREWIVICPVCETPVEVEATQDDYGAYHGKDADQFPECPECHALIEAVSVKVQEARP